MNAINNNLAEFLNCYPAYVLETIDQRYASEIYGSKLGRWVHLNLLHPISKLFLITPTSEVSPRYQFSFKWAVRAVLAIVKDKPIEQIFPHIGASRNEIMLGLIVWLAMNHLEESVRFLGGSSKRSYPEFWLYVYMFLSDRSIDYSLISTFEEWSKIGTLRCDLLRNVQTVEPIKYSGIQVLSNFNFAVELGSMVLGTYHPYTTNRGWGSRYHIASTYKEHLKLVKATNKAEFNRLMSEYEIDKARVHKLLKSYSLFFHLSRQQTVNSKLIADVREIIKLGHLQEICRLVDSHPRDGRIPTARFILRNIEVFLSGLTDSGNFADWEIRLVHAGAGNLFCILADSYEFNLDFPTV